MLNPSDCLRHPPPLEKGRIIAKTVLEGVSIQTETLPIIRVGMAGNLKHAIIFA